MRSHPPTTTEYAVPTWPKSVDPADLLLGYNPLADELVVAFGGANRSHYVEPLDAGPADYVSLLLDPDTDEVVGVMIEQAREVAVARHPTWQPVLDAAPTEPTMRRADPAVWPLISAFIEDVREIARLHSANV
jgi:hypothetical protein